MSGAPSRKNPGVGERSHFRRARNLGPHPDRPSSGPLHPHRSHFFPGPPPTRTSVFFSLIFRFFCFFCFFFFFLGGGGARGGGGGGEQASGLCVRLLGRGGWEGRGGGASGRFVRLLVGRSGRVSERARRSLGGGGASERASDSRESCSQECIVDCGAPLHMMSKNELPQSSPFPAPLLASVVYQAGATSQNLGVLGGTPTLDKTVGSRA